MKRTPILFLGMATLTPVLAWSADIIHHSAEGPTQILRSHGDQIYFQICANEERITRVGDCQRLGTYRVPRSSFKTAVWQREDQGSKPGAYSHIASVLHTYGNAFIASPEVNSELHATLSEIDLAGVIHTVKTGIYFTSEYWNLTSLRTHIAQNDSYSYQDHYEDCEISVSRAKPKRKTFSQIIEERTAIEKIRSAGNQDPEQQEYLRAHIRAKGVYESDTEYRNRMHVLQTRYEEGRREYERLNPRSTPYWYSVTNRRSGEHLFGDAGVLPRVFNTEPLETFLRKNLYAILGRCLPPLEEGSPREPSPFKPASASKVDSLYGLGT